MRKMKWFVSKQKQNRRTCMRGKWSRRGCLQGRTLRRNGGFATGTPDMHPFVLSQFTAFLALGDRSSFLLNLKEGSIRMMTWWGTMALDTGCTRKHTLSQCLLWGMQRRGGQYHENFVPLTYTWEPSKLHLNRINSGWIPYHNYVLFPFHMKTSSTELSGS